MTLILAKTVASGVTAIIAALLVLATPPALGQASENSETRLGETRGQMADSPPVAVRSHSYYRELAWAGFVALGREGSISVTFDEHTYVETPAELVWRDDTAMLITSATLPDACHNCAGYLGVYYLSRDDNGFVLDKAGRKPSAAPTGACRRSRGASQTNSATIPSSMRRTAVSRWASRAAAFR